jgi:N6-L-threonylcarbamoyladenine synthase
VLILGLETSCDETAAAVVRDGRDVLSNVVASQTDLHSEYGGVVPELAGRAHSERVLPVVRRALADAGATLEQIGAVAVGHRPGLIGSLVVGVSAAKALAWSLGVPLVAVDHVWAHLYAGELDRAPDAAELGFPARGFPALGLVVSGGHTSLYLVRSWTRFERLGATIDDAMGEAFDKAATILGLPFPGGPNLDKLASSEGANDRAHEFPVSRLSAESLDFSFSGLKTSLLYAVRGLPGPGGVFERDHAALSAERRRDLAASFQRAAVKAAVVKVERALAAFESRAGAACARLLVGGGVTANSRLRREIAALALRAGLAVELPRMEFCVDNAAMIGGLAFRHLESGVRSGMDVRAEPTTAC